MYHSQGEQDIEPTIANTLLADIIDFFTDKNYNQNAVDVLMKFLADVPELNLNIYQNNGGQIWILNFSADNHTHTENVKFSHDNLNTAGNHYDTITLLSKSKKTEDKSREKEAYQHFRNYS